MELSLNKKFYDKKAICKTIDIFEKRELGNFEFISGDDYYKVMDRNMDEKNREIMADNFCNFLIAQMKKKNKR